MKLESTKKIEIIKDFAFKATLFGFSVYINDSLDYCVFTHSRHNKVVSVTFDSDNDLVFIGNYKPSMKHGSGWRIANNNSLLTYTNLMMIITSKAPEWANPSPTYETIESYLARASKTNSKYTLYVKEVMHQPIASFNDCK